MRRFLRIIRPGSRFFQTCSFLISVTYSPCMFTCDTHLACAHALG